MNTPTQYPDLPQLGGPVFLTEAGLETELIFDHGIDLPDFASFPLLQNQAQRELLARYYSAFIDIARRDGAGVVFETPTWRANPDWGTRLGYGATSLDRANQDAVALLKELRSANPDVTIVISGNVGPRGDGYQVDQAMTESEASSYHGPQIESLANAGADLVTALTLNYCDEAIGIVAAADAAKIPVVISFTVETNGLLPSGQPLADAIEVVDEATNQRAAYFMVNCAHPSHFVDVFAQPGPWERIRGVRANASTMSHEELDNAEELDRGDPHDLASAYLALRDVLPALSVVGGCCGTDLAHVDHISAAFSA